MSGASITVDSPDLDRAIAALDARGWDRAALPPVRNAIRKSINLVRKYVRAEAAPHRRSGKMRDRVRTRFSGTSTGWAFWGGMKSTGAPSNLIVGGVKPHAIAAGGAVMPMWEGRGKWRKGEGRGVTGFARRVEHPGFAADPFVDRGIDRARPELQAFFDAAAATMAKELAYRMERR